MSITIRPLTEELIPDYLDFFDNRAFTDDNPNGPCYCNASIMTTGEIKRMSKEFGNDCKGVLRKYAVKQLSDGKMHGYLAFDGAVSIGWCNAADMDSYTPNFFDFIPKFARRRKCGKTMSVICFEIAPEYRGQGIASAFLERICADAKNDGFTAVEGYVKILKKPVYYDFTGHVRLFEKAGFIKVAEKRERAVMRKIL